MKVPFCHLITVFAIHFDKNNLVGCEVRELHNMCKHIDTRVEDDAQSQRKSADVTQVFDQKADFFA